MEAVCPACRSPYAAAACPSLHLHTVLTSHLLPHQPSLTTAAFASRLTMAHNTRYQPVARDSLDEEQRYTQAPPSYQAEPVVGEARTEDDNVPDDFKVHSHRACGI